MCYRWRCFSISTSLPLWERAELSGVKQTGQKNLMGVTGAMKGGGKGWKLRKRIHYLTRGPGTPTGCQIVRDQEASHNSIWL